MVRAGGTRSRGERSAATRELILTTAERLFAEHGLFAVSNRQISEAAGQGNNTAVGYHFGTKADLLRAIVRRHSERIEQLRTAMVGQVRDSTDVRAWATCLVHPATDHLAELGPPTWFARFSAQMTADPASRSIMYEETFRSPSLIEAIRGFDRCLPGMPARVRAERGDMARLLMVHMCAERELALAEGGAAGRDGWAMTAAGLVDALVGLWTAPITGPDGGIRDPRTTTKEEPA
ncbi:TetR/AcrR family transcriptional regulator [Marinactinospora thermotolerans]|uniref:Transcriptional regulator, TetR family n=1 Tax=Marinactinospora thermotolerans DSM 45154 TaxID=1122192 RepID=A0A1T4SRC1_9ACTN|nr:TetR/AcrR family transcriptional regulator [Marinactinospora thermotolerans]SKA30779.1 transcriptional regulator, TetR family [Marinactinospora thermotolerans DSM 45154]